MLHGPPGCAKTSLVRALASNLHASFHQLSASSVFSPYVGEAEGAVRDCFARARASTPAIIFLDEMEALAGRRGAGEESHRVGERVLSTLLNEMDGVEGGAAGVVVVGATNRVDSVDEALLRPGRFDYIIEVPLPDVNAREAILGLYVARMPLGSDVKLRNLAERLQGWSGAQLEALCGEAAMEALRERVRGGIATHDVIVGARHFEITLNDAPKTQEQ